MKTHVTRLRTATSATTSLRIAALLLALVPAGLALSCDAAFDFGLLDPSARANDGDEPGGSGSGSSGGLPGSGGGPVNGGAGSDNDDEDVIAALLRDSDGDGTRDLDEIQNGTDPLDPTEGGDLDGDGIPNGTDDDVDGDGIENGDDPDVDGDGIENGADDDVDGDGLEAAEDGDDDGDGIPDDEDDDDDGDGEPDCDCEHGVCSSFGGLCFCDPGWKGESCDEFHCRDVDDCNFGTCVGPNACRCDSGWESIGSFPCIRFHCRQARNCNNHGFCIGPNVCRCDADWRGLDDCSIHSCDRTPSLCDDGDPCTTDTCDPSAGCENEAIECTDPEICVNGECTDPCNSAADCDDGRGCRAGGCFECEEDSECRDGDPCTIDECEDQLGCTNVDVSCDASEECVFGKCVESCFDESDCDVTESCREGGCLEDCADDGDCGDEEKCDDGGSCIPDEQEEDPNQP